MKYYLPLTDEITKTPDESAWAIPLWEEPEHFHNTSFDGPLQLVWDSVSIGALKKCPRYYNWTVKEGWQLFPQPSPLSFGIHFHKCMETWHKLLSKGVCKHVALLHCTRLAMLLGETIVSDRTERTKETLTRCVVWYLDQFQNDIAVTTTAVDGTPSVELSFVLPLFDIDDHQFYLAGHFDRVVEFLGEYFICDYKTTKSQLNDRFFNDFKPNTQVEGYLAAGHILAGTTKAIPETPVGLIIDGIQLGVNFNRFSRSIIKYSRLEINQFLDNLRMWLRTAKLYAEAEHWPANEASCSNYGGCVFRSICSQTPAKHDRLLNANFTRNTWDPRRSR